MAATKFGASRTRASAVLCAALCALSASAIDLKFSHRLHLNRVNARAQCADCHTTAAASARAEDSLLPKEAACLKCHDGRKARKDCTVCHADPKKATSFAAVARTFRFSHRRHVEFGNLAPVLADAIRKGRYFSQPPPAPADLKTQNACGACHRGVARVDLAGPANLPQMADCIVCHDKIDPPFSCEFCHTKEAIKEGKIKPASHTPNYLDAHSGRNARLDKPSCVICHGINFRCLGCH